MCCIYMPTYYSTLGYKGYDPDKDETGMEGITLAEQIIRTHGFPGTSIANLIAPDTSPLNGLRRVARIAFSPVSKKRGGKPTKRELQDRVTQLKTLGVPVREDYLSLPRRELLRYSLNLQRGIIQSADRYCPEVRASFNRPSSPLDEL